MLEKNTPLLPPPGERANLLVPSGLADLWRESQVWPPTCEAQNLADGRAVSQKHAHQRGK